MKKDILSVSKIGFGYAIAEQFHILNVRQIALIPNTCSLSPRQKELMSNKDDTLFITGVPNDYISELVEEQVNYGAIFLGCRACELKRAVFCLDLKDKIIDGFVIIPI